MSQIGLFYNTTGETGSTLREYTKKAITQNDWVLDMMRFLRTATPSEVHLRLGTNAPVTSIRRAMTTLAKQGLLTKTSVKSVGPYGRREHVWEYNEPTPQ